MYLEPAPVTGLKLVHITSTEVQLSWLPISCLEQRGPFVGFGYQLTNETAPSGRVTRSLTNETTLCLTSLVPFTNYSVAVWFSNGEYVGKTAVVAFTTEEDGNLFQPLT